jgi:hypothetical protein
LENQEGVMSGLMTRMEKDGMTRSLKNVRNNIPGIYVNATLPSPIGPNQPYSETIGCAIACDVDFSLYRPSRVWQGLAT